MSSLRQPAVKEIRRAVGEDEAGFRGKMMLFGAGFEGDLAKRLQ